MSILVEDISLFGYDLDESLSISSFGYLHGVQPEDIIDYCANAKLRLVEQFKRSTDLQNMICAFLEEAQDLEGVFQDLKIFRAVDNAVGEQLNQMADVVGADIDGLNDADARARIRFQIGLNISNGEPETVITFVKEITDSTFVQYFEAWPAKISLFIDGSTIPIGLNAMIQGVAPAGVGVDVTTSYGGGTPFAVLPEGGIPDPDALGFGEINLPLEGGEIAERIVI